MLYLPPPGKYLDIVTVAAGIFAASGSCVSSSSCSTFYADPVPTIPLCSSSCSNNLHSPNSAKVCVVCHTSCDPASPA